MAPRPRTQVLGELPEQVHKAEERVHAMAHDVADKAQQECAAWPPGQSACLLSAMHVLRGRKVCYSLCKECHYGVRRC